MIPSDFATLLPLLNEELFNDHYFSIVFEKQHSILNIKPERVNFKATDKDDLCVQVCRYLMEKYNNSAAMTDISIVSYFE